MEFPNTSHVMERTENSISGKILYRKYEKIILGNIFSVYICLITCMKRILSSLPQIGRAGDRSEAIQESGYIIA